MADHLNALADGPLDPAVLHRMVARAEGNVRGNGQVVYKSGVVSAGLSTTVLPHASAGASFQAAMRSGKFQGTICPQTPIGAAVCPARIAHSSLSAQPA